MSDPPKAAIAFGVDGLSELIRSVHLSAGVFLSADLARPWCLRSELQASDCSPLCGPVDRLILFHFVERGRLRVHVDGESPEEFDEGEVAILPTNHPHLLGGDLNHPPVSALSVATQDSQGWTFIQRGSGGERTRLICGFLGGRRGPHSLLLEHLPSLMRFDTRHDPLGHWMQRTLRFAASEVRDGRPGSDALMARLSELLFLEAVRAHLRSISEREPSGWLSALNDPLLGRALAELHRDFAHPWSVEELGRRVGASRSSLASHFRDVMGTTPMQYLTKIRMLSAAGLVDEGRLSMAEVAQRVGYESESSFSRAFRRFHGTSPRRYRGTEPAP